MMNRFLKYINIVAFVFAISLLIFVVVYKREDVKVGDGVISQNIVINDDYEFVDKNLLYSNYSITLTKDMTPDKYRIYDSGDNWFQRTNGGLTKITREYVRMVVCSTVLGNKFTDYENEICSEVF